MIMNLRKLLLTELLKLTPNGVIDRYSTFDEYLKSDTKVKESKRKNV